MVLGVHIKKTQALASRSRVNYLVDVGERKMIFQAGLIDMLEIDTHTE